MTLYQKPYEAKFAVAPMLDWTDRHCRYFHRLLTRKALLYTEMVVADAALHGFRDRLLGFDATEHPIALQLGGSDPEKLKEAAKIGADFGYDEINLNVGCPSDRVQSGTFGACLMLEPATVSACVAAMKKAVNIPVTVKCRIGVDEQDTETALDNFGHCVLDAGADAIWVHARKAWLKGLSPKENREIPPLDYERVHRFKEKNNNVFIGINGGMKTIDEALTRRGNCDGVMLGRAAYHEPAQLGLVDSLFYGLAAKPLDYKAIIDEMAIYADRHIAAGGRLSHVARHMTGLFHGMGGAKRWRQILSTKANAPDATGAILHEAFLEICENPEYS